VLLELGLEPLLDQPEGEALPASHLIAAQATANTIVESDRPFSLMVELQSLLALLVWPMLWY